MYRVTGSPVLAGALCDLRHGTLAWGGTHWEVAVASAGGRGGAQVCNCGFVLGALGGFGKPLWGLELSLSRRVTVAQQNITPVRLTKPRFVEDVCLRCSDVDQTRLDGDSVGRARRGRCEAVGRRCGPEEFNTAQGLPQVREASCGPKLAPVLLC